LKLPARYVVLVALVCAFVVPGCQAAAPAAPPEEPPELSISVQSLTFECDTRHRDVPMSSAISVSNTGGGSLDWRAASDAAWATVAPTGGQGNGGDVTLWVNPLGLAVGQHTATVTFDSNGGQETVDVTLTIVRYTETSHVTFTIDPTKRTEYDWTYGNRGTPFNLRNHQEVDLRWTAIGEQPNVYVMMEGAGLSYHGIATSPGGPIDAFIRVPNHSELYGTYSVSPLRFGHSNGDATDSGDVTLYISETIDRVGQRALYPPGYYELTFEVLSAKPLWSNYDVLYGSEVTIELDITVRDTDD